MPETVCPEPEARIRSKSPGSFGVVIKSVPNHDSATTLKLLITHK